LELLFEIGAGICDLLTGHLIGCLNVVFGSGFSW